MLARLIVPAALGGLMSALFAVPAGAAPCTALAAPSANPGTLAGTIKCVNGDPANQYVDIAAGDRTVTVYVPQGTLVQPASKSLAATSSSYRSFTDLRAGTAVTIYTTLTGGKVTATIISLPK